MLDRAQRLALFMDGAFEDGTGKMGLGALRYSPNPIECIVDRRHAGEDSIPLTGVLRKVPIVATLEEAQALGAQVLVLGIAPPGGLIPLEWNPVIDEAVRRGFCLVNGLHDLIGPRYHSLAAGQWIWDIRIEPAGIGTASGLAAGLKNRRVLMIGTDMSIGKMTAGLEIYAGARARGIQSEFIATGQIGITITGQGIPLDAIRVDFAAGAVEREVMKVRDADLVIIEGQGSLLHPASSANLPLLRGSMPTDFVLCHRAETDHLSRIPWVRVPPLQDLARLYEELASSFGNFPRPKTIGICLNTSHLAENAALEEIAKTTKETGITTIDPVRFGVNQIVDALAPG